MAQTGICGSHAQPHRRGGRFTDAGIAQQQDRPAAFQPASVQASCRGKVKPLRAAPHFEHYRREDRGIGCLLGNPQRIDGFHRFSHQQPFGSQAEAMNQPWRVGPAGLTQDFLGGNPKKWCR
jgi:hypothetical protein